MILWGWLIVVAVVVASGPGGLDQMTQTSQVVSLLVAVCGLLIRIAWLLDQQPRRLGR